MALLHLQCRAFLCRCSGDTVTIMMKLQPYLWLSKSAVLAHIPAQNCKLLVRETTWLKSFCEEAFCQSSHVKGTDWPAPDVQKSGTFYSVLQENQLWASASWIPRKNCGLPGSQVSAIHRKYYKNCYFQDAAMHLSLGSPILPAWSAPVQGLKALFTFS